jgi:hypothetical protein
MLKYIKDEPRFTILGFGCGPGETSKFLPNSVTSRSVWKAPRIFLAGYMKQRGVGEYTAEMARSYSGCEVWQQDSSQARSAG